MAAYQAIPINLEEYFSSSPVESILPSSSGNEGDRDHRKKLMVLGGLLGVFALILVIVIPIVHHKHHHHKGMMTPLTDVSVPDMEDPSLWKALEDEDAFHDDLPEIEIDDLVERDSSSHDFFNDDEYDKEDDALSKVDDDLAMQDEEIASVDETVKVERTPDRDELLSEDFYNEDDKLGNMGTDDDAFEEGLYDEFFEEFP